MLIDLGEDWSVAEEASPPEAPNWTTWRTVVAVIALLPALLTAAAAPRPQPQLIVLADLELDAPQEGIDLLHDGVVVRTWRAVTVYEDDGRVRWTSGRRGIGGYAGTDEKHGMVILHDVRDETTTTKAVSLVDGRVLWSFDGQAEVVGDFIVVRGMDRSATVYDVATGARRWRAEDAISHHTDESQNTIITLTKAGEIIERELPTGQPIRGAKIELPPGEHHFLESFEDDLVIFYHVQGQDGSKMIRLDRATFALIPDPTLSRQGRPSTRALDCGPVRCMLDQRRNVVTVLDAQTGQRLWVPDEDRGLQHTPIGLVSYPLFESGASANLMLHDPQTGKVTGSFPGWQPIRNPSDGYRIAPVVIRRVVAKTDRSWFAGFPPTGFRVYGSIPRNVFSCQHNAPRLACVASERRLLILEIAQVK